MKKTLLMFALIALAGSVIIGSAGSISYGASEGLVIYIIFGVLNLLFGGWHTWKFVKEYNLLTGKID